MYQYSLNNNSLNIILEQALSDEDEYSRNEKIRIGCKQLSQQLPFLTTFNNAQTIKYLICCYPFFKTNIELLVSILFERFQTLDFFNSFFMALDEISRYPEQRIMLSQHRSLKQSQNKSQRKLQQCSINHYSQSVIKEMFTIKQFSSLYLYSLFQLGIELQLHLECQAKIFINYIKHTQNEKFITDLIEIFQSIKRNILKNTAWSIKLEDQIEYYFYSIFHQPSPTKIDLQTIKNVSDSEEDQEIIEVDMNVAIEHWLYNNQGDQIFNQIEYFRNESYFEFMMKFLFDPLSQLPISEWKKQTFSKDIINDFRPYKTKCQIISNEYTARSLKLLIILTDDNNYQLICKTVPKLIMKLIYYIYESLNDIERTVNLFHIGFLLDYLLIQSPKTCLYLITDLNLLFSLGMYLYNPALLNIFTKLLNMIDDEYQLGIHAQEHLWMYIQQTNFIEFLSNCMINQNIDRQKLERTYKPDSIIHIIGLMKAESNFDKLPTLKENYSTQKKQLTDLLGQITPGKNPNDFYSISQNNWHLYNEIQENINFQEFDTKDIDNLMSFVKERSYNYSKYAIKYSDTKFKKQKTILLSQYNSVSPTNKNLDFPIKSTQVYIKKNQEKFTQNKKSRLNSATKQKKYIQTQKLFHQDSQQKQNLIMNTSIRLRTVGSDRSDYSSNNGFSSSRLKTIYPSIKMQQESEFERTLINFQHNEYYTQAYSSLILSLISSCFNYIWKKQNCQGIVKLQTKLNTDNIFFVILNKNQVEKYFQIYLFGIINSYDQDLSSSDEFGQIINLIYQNYPQLKLKNQIIDNLKQCFINILDYLCKIIIKFNQQQQQMSHYQRNFKKLLIITTLFNGLQLFEQNKSQSYSNNPYLYLNETVLHILIIWYFDSVEINIHQSLFIQLINLILSRAPQHILMHFIFKLGFVSSLYNFMCKYNKNGIINTQGVESFYLHLRQIIYIINENIQHRQLQVLGQSLQQLQSWQQLLQILPDPTNKAILILNQRMQCNSIYLPIKSLKNNEIEGQFQTKTIFESIKQKLNVHQPVEQTLKNNKFLSCIKETFNKQNDLSKKNKKILNK